MTQTTYIVHINININSDVWILFIYLFCVDTFDRCGAAAAAFDNSKHTLALAHTITNHSSFGMQISRIKLEVIKRESEKMLWLTRPKSIFSLLFHSSLTVIQCWKRSFDKYVCINFVCVCEYFFGVFLFFVATFLYPSENWDKMLFFFLSNHDKCIR